MANKSHSTPFELTRTQQSLIFTAGCVRKARQILPIYFKANYTSLTQQQHVPNQSTRPPHLQHKSKRQKTTIA